MMNSKEFVNKLIVFSKEQINYYENKIAEDEKYPSLQQCHQEELISTQEGLNHFLKIKQDLDRLEQLEKERQEVETWLSSKETNTFDEIATMIKKANDYDVLVNKCKQLEKENQELKETIDKLQIDYDSLDFEQAELYKENTKLKQAIKLLKPLVVVKKINGGYVVNARGFATLTECAYELLKSVLEED